MLVRGCNKLNMPALAEQMRGKIRTLKEERDKDINKQMKLLTIIPTFIAELLINLASFVTYNIGLSIPPLRMK